MKYRDPKTGEVFEAIGAARARACRDHACDDCPLGQFNQGELYGDTCAKFVKEYPTVAARLMGLEVVEDKEEPMEKKEMPRICEVLGVEVGEKFTYPGMIGEFWITENGHLRSVVDDDDNKLMTCVPTLINHPDRIIRKPRFTQEEVADAKALIRILGATGIERTEYGGNLCAVIEENAKIVIDQGLFPSLRPGQSISLDHIVREGRHGTDHP